MITFPKDLKNAISSGEAIAVVGSGLSIAAGFPSWRKLLDLMIQECEQYIPNFSDKNELKRLLDKEMFLEVAEECKRHLGVSLYGDFIQRTFRIPSIKPITIHKLILQSPFSSILTTNYDNLLERAYVENRSEKNWPIVYSQKNIAQLGKLPGDRNFFIFKMHGTVDDINSIVLTRHDYQQIIHNEQAYRTVLQSLCSTRTLIFLGYGLQDPDLNLMLSEQSAIFKNFGRRHFAFIANTSDILIRSFSGQYNITAIPYNAKEDHEELNSVLISLFEDIKRDSTSVSRTLEEDAAELSPFKFLDYYDSQDRNLFFGREEEEKIVLRSLLAHRIFILFGQSGTGKTSLLKAALMPELSSRGYFPIYFRLRNSRFDDILEELKRYFFFPDRDLSNDPKQAALDFAKALKSDEKKPVFIIDQAEQLFLDTDNVQLRLTASFFQSVIEEKFLNCHLVITIREDHFVRLNQLSEFFPDIFNNRFELKSLNWMAARSAIESPLKKIGIGCDEAFIEKVLHDLDRGGIEPPQLQVVCSAVWDALPLHTNKIEIAIYENLGGAQSILSSFISFVLKSFRDEDREVARNILKTLVGPTVSRVSLSFEDLFTKLRSNYGKDMLRRVLQALHSQRLIRVHDEINGPTYELTHDYLIPSINQWISKEERQSRRISGVFDHEKDICVHLGDLIPLERARFLEPLITDPSISEDDKELIRKSILKGETEQKERRILEHQLMQVQRIESLGTLAGGIAHDFNNILGIILAYSTILERVSTDQGKFAEGIKAINSAVSRGAALVRQILTFARQTDITIEPMSIPELAHEVATMLQETFPKVIEFKEVFEPDVPFIQADHSQMHQVILNLCVNARDAMPKGGFITITIQTMKLEKIIQQFPSANFDRYVCLSVSDTGIGMDEATKSRIFDPFFTTKELGKGTGLGLSVVLGVVQAHKGFIGVESTPGNGSTFRLYLPTPVHDQPSADAYPKKDSIDIEGTETILIVEDEEIILETVRVILESNGYRVYSAKDGIEAVELYIKHQSEIALVVSDIGMPRMTGIDEFKKLKEICPDVKVILASGFLDSKMRETVQEMGVKLFIQKPYNLNEVLVGIRNVLDN